MEIKGKTILVTGGAKRIGAHIAEELSKCGANLIIHYNASENEALETAERCRKHGAKVELVRCDFSVGASELIPFVRKSDAMVCNASEFRRTELERVTDEDISRGIKIDFISHFMLIKELWSEAMRRGDTLKVIVISDAKRIRRNFVPYHFGKRLLEYVVEEMAEIFAPHLTINCVSLGIVLPPQGKDRTQIDELIRAVPMRREGKLSEVFSAVRFLLENDYVTGQVIKVSGGL